MTKRQADAIVAAIEVIEEGRIALGVEMLRVALREANHVPPPLRIVKTSEPRN